MCCPHLAVTISSTPPAASIKREDIEEEETASQRIWRTAPRAAYDWQLDRLLWPYNDEFLSQYFSYSVSNHRPPLDQGFLKLSSNAYINDDRWVNTKTHWDVVFVVLYILWLFRTWVSYVPYKRCNLVLESVRQRLWQCMIVCTLCRVRQIVYFKWLGRSENLESRVVSVKLCVAWAGMREIGSLRLVLWFSGINLVLQQEDCRLIPYN